MTPGAAATLHTAPLLDLPDLHLADRLNIAPLLDLYDPPLADRPTIEDDVNVTSKNSSPPANEHFKNDFGRIPVATVAIGSAVVVGVYL